MVTFVAGAWQKAVKLLQECSTKQTGQHGGRGSFQQDVSANGHSKQDPHPAQSSLEKARAAAAGGLSIAGQACAHSTVWCALLSALCQNA